MNMADEPEGSAPSGRSRTAKPKPVAAKAAPEKPKRKSEPPTITDDFTGKFLRVGNKLYRTSDDKSPIVRIAGDRLRLCGAAAPRRRAPFRFISHVHRLPL